MTEDTLVPYGWNSIDPQKVSYEFGEARYGTSANDIPANATGEEGGEDDYHSTNVDPDGKFGAAKVEGGLKSGYGNTDDYKPKTGDKDPRDVGTIRLPVGHVVLEDGEHQGRNYYLAQDIKSGKFYTVIPNYKEGEEFKSPMKTNRTDAMGEAYRALNASLPDSALAQFKKRFPETEALTNVYDK
jgi:hypothetical protein